MSLTRSCKVSWHVLSCACIVLSITCAGRVKSSDMTLCSSYIVEYISEFTSWSGIVEWNGGVDYWSGVLDCITGVPRSQIGQSAVATTSIFNTIKLRLGIVLSTSTQGSLNSMYQREPGHGQGSVTTAVKLRGVSDYG